ncbi:MAG: hypothetical protein NVS2B17_26590 [Candidatus Velthaea sp.]
MFALVVRFELVPELAAEFDSLMAETVSAIRFSEPGTVSYVCCKVNDSEFSRVFMEIYDSQQAFEAHEQASETVRFLRLRKTMIASRRVEFLQPYEWKL